MNAVYPGSFDPVTLGHLDVIERAARLVERLTVAVTHNPNKEHRFSIAERCNMLKTSTAHLNNVEIKTFDGLLVHFVRKQEAQAVIRGIRAISDFDVEFQMATTNRTLDREIETLFIMTDTRYAYLSSSLVRELSKLGGDISSMVPQAVLGHFVKRA